MEHEATAGHDDREAFPVPAGLRESAAREGWEAWLDALPATVRRLQAEWSLSVGEPFRPGGHTAWVAPVVAGGDLLVLKIGRRHPEAEHEADGLRRWDGAGTVGLHADAKLGDTAVLLLERCVPGDALSARPEHEQDAVITGLLRRLWRDPGPDHAFRPLQEMCDQWVDGFERGLEGRSTGLDPGIVRDGMALFRSLPASADRAVLLCTDLHAGNVLAAQRERWLVIDPKPYVGDPTYDALQHLLNCGDRLRSDPLGLVRRIAGMLDLDPDRLSLWLFARCVVESARWPGLADVARRIAP